MKISSTIQHCENKQEHSQINIYGMLYAFMLFLTELQRVAHQLPQSIAPLSKSDMHWEPEIRFWIMNEHQWVWANQEKQSNDLCTS